jgi:LAS superfamily LD-carboxypeptidase LdcB
MKKYLLTILILSAFISFSFAQNQKIWQKFSIITKDNLTSFLWLIDYSNLPDDNIQKFVWVNQPFSNKSYEPTDLVSLQWRSHISAQARHTFRKEAADALEKMANDFYAQFWTNIVVASAYRSYNYQKNSISESCKQSWRCAREWESEHQLWLAVDLREATNEQKFLSKYQKYYNWLHDNAHLYWFHQSYQNWREFDGYYIEPRHWRYLWIELATKLHKKDITFTQYVNLTKANIK